MSRLFKAFASCLLANKSRPGRKGECQVEVALGVPQLRHKILKGLNLSSPSRTAHKIRAVHRFEYREADRVDDPATLIGASG
jgi:hypothetical protein